MRVVLFSLMVAFTFAAQAEFDPKYHTIDSVEVKELAVERLDYNDVQFNPDDCNVPGAAKNLGELSVLIDQIINIGQRIWTVVESNRPVSNFRSNSASAMPRGVNCWLDMHSWKMPESRTYEIAYKNLYGMKVVKFKYRIVYTYGGKYNDQGAYLAKVAVYPGQIDVSWGFTFNAEVQIPSVMNMGTTQSPVAGMQMHVKWSVDTVLQHKEQTESYFINGNGEFRQL